MRRLVALSAALVVLALAAAGCRSDGREMRPARADQDSTISTTTPPTDPTSDDASVNTVAADDEFFDTLGSDFDSDFATEPSLVASTSAVAVAAPTVTAPWRDGAPIDARYSCKGENVSPALSWSPAPAGTQQIAITMIDRDFTSFNHWTLTGVAAVATTLAEGSALGAGGYSGPCPPAGTTHTYEITVHYLGTPLNVTSDTGVSLRPAIDAATIASAKVTGTFTGS